MAEQKGILKVRNICEFCLLIKDITYDFQVFSLWGVCTDLFAGGNAFLWINSDNTRK